MLYLLETNLPENKSVLYALTYIYGIGDSTAFRICKNLGFSANLKINDLTQEQILEILHVIESLDLVLNNELKKLFKTFSLFLSVPHSHTRACIIHTTHEHTRARAHAHTHTHTHM